MNSYLCKKEDGLPVLQKQFFMQGDGLSVWRPPPAPSRRLPSLRRLGGSALPLSSACLWFKALGAGIFYPAQYQCAWQGQDIPASCRTASLADGSPPTE